MLASARTATASSPLASPSLKHVFEFAHAHTHVHAHSPLVGLGIMNVNVVGQGASGVASSSSSTHTGYGSGQPIVQRPRLPRMQTSDDAEQIPRTPRLESAPTLPPSVFSPISLSPTTARSPFIADGYYSNDNVPSGDTGMVVSSSQSMNNHTTAYRRPAATNNNSHSTLKSSIHTSLQEIERIGLGISGILLKESSITDNGMFADVSVNAVDSSSNPPQRRATVRPRSKRVVKFKTPEQIIVPSNTSDESDGHSSDAGHENGLGSHHYARGRRSLALNGLRSCKDHVPTPYYGPNGESSWL